MTRIYADLGRRPSYPDLVLFYAEQAALNAVLHTARDPPALLPAWCNWVCHRAMRAGRQDPPRTQPVLSPPRRRSHEWAEQGRRV
jgi:hypothetical protein